jgi:hypothetical protein
LPFVPAEILRLARGAIINQHIVVVVVVIVVVVVVVVTSLTGNNGRTPEYREACLPASA